MEVVWVSGASAQDARDRELKVIFENTSNVTQLATLTLLSKVSGVGAAAVTACLCQSLPRRLLPWWVCLAWVAGCAASAKPDFPHLTRAVKLPP